MAQRVIGRALRETAKQQTDQAWPHADIEQRASACEKISIQHSLQHLQGYPGVAEKIAANKLTLHGWHFDLSTGRLEEINP